MLSALLYNRDWDGVFEVLFDDDSLPLFDFNQEEDGNGESPSSLSLDIGKALSRLGLVDGDGGDDGTAKESEDEISDSEHNGRQSTHEAAEHTTTGTTVTVTLNHEPPSASLATTTTSSNISRPTIKRGDNLLHAICQFQPPLDLVLLVTQEWPYMARQSDDRSTGQYPLHRAAQYGCTSKVVKHLLSEFGDAAMGADHNGDLPLHLACRPIQWQLPQRSAPESFSSSPDNDEREEEPAPIYIHAGSAVIRAFCDHAPQASNVEDLDGCNPLEIAIDHGLSKKICQLLLETSEIAWKEEKQKQEQQALKEKEHQELLFIQEREKEARRMSDVARAQAQTQAAAEDLLWSLSLSCLPPYSEMLLQYRAVAEQKKQGNPSSSCVSSSFKNIVHHNHQQPLTNNSNGSSKGGPRSMRRNSLIAESA
jgi:hypothetical protein